MEAGIRTGYENEFDFPQRDALKTYLLATVPRSGSTYLSHLLWKTGCLGAPLEYLNFEPAGPYGFASGSPDRQRRLWDHVIHHRVSPNGVFGVKGFPDQFQLLERDNFQLLRDVLRAIVPGRRSARIVRLRRRDSTAHAVSYARAILSGVWRHEQEGRRVEPEYKAEAVENAGALLERQEHTWDMMFEDLGVDPLVLWYEDVITAPDAASRSVADYLGVTLDPALNIAVPEVKRQDQAGARDWIGRHRP